MPNYVRNASRLLFNVSSMVAAGPVVAGVLAWLVLPDEAPSTRVLLAASVFLFYAGLVLMLSAVRRVDEVRSRQLFYAALQGRLRNGERLRRRGVAAGSLRAGFWLWRTEHVIDRHYPEETERLTMGIGREAPIEDYIDNIRALMEKQRTEARIAEEQPPS